jgi:beta-xylosidase
MGLNGMSQVKVIDSNQTMRDDILRVNDVFFAHPSNDAYAAVRPQGGPKIAHPLVDVPLGACHILLHSNGNYYMTGTYGGYDVKVNDGIYLWKSTDLCHWEALGNVFDIEAHGSWSSSRAIRFEIMTRRGPQRIHLKDEPGCDYRAVIAPKLFEIAGTVYITYAMNYGGTGLLRSLTGLPEGPFGEDNQITADGYSASLFQDDDGLVYYLYGSGKIARMADDMRNVIESFTSLHTSTDYQQYTTVQRAVETPDVGESGAYMIKHEGAYYLFCADHFYRMGEPNYDNFVAVSSHLRGPFSRRYLALPHGGEATYFKDKQGQWHGVFAGHDRYALHVDRCAIVPMQFGPDRHVRAADGYIFENSPVGRSTPLRWQEGVGNFIRDTQISQGHDGYYYLTGTTKASSEHQGIELWRSRTMDDFEYLGIVWRPESGEKHAYNAKKHGQTRAFWAPEIHYVRNNYYITFSLQFGGTLLLRSATGQGEGPYEFVGPITDEWIDSSLFEDEDGTVYFVWQDGKIAKMKEDMSGLAEEMTLLTDANGNTVGYEGVSLVRMDGKYVLSAAAWQGDIRVDGTYDLMCAVSDCVHGPYHVRHVAVPHGGHGSLFQSFTGQWYATLFGNDRTAPYRKRPGVIPVKLVDSKVVTIEI